MHISFSPNSKNQKVMADKNPFTVEKAVSHQSPQRNEGDTMGNTHQFDSYNSRFRISAANQRFSRDPWPQRPAERAAGEQTGYIGEMHRYREGTQRKPSSHGGFAGAHLEDVEVDDYPSLNYDDDRCQFSSVIQDTFQIGSLILEMVMYIYCAPELETIDTSGGQSGTRGARRSTSVGFFSFLCQGPQQ